MVRDDVDHPGWTDGIFNPNNDVHATINQLGFYFLLEDLQVVLSVELDVQALLLVVIPLLSQIGIDWMELVWRIKFVEIIKANPAGFGPVTGPGVPQTTQYWRLE